MPDVVTISNETAHFYSLTLTNKDHRERSKHFEANYIKKNMAAPSLSVHEILRTECLVTQYFGILPPSIYRHELR
jgi:hypothetical protein